MKYTKFVRDVIFCFDPFIILVKKGKEAPSEEMKEDMRTKKFIVYGLTSYTFLQTFAINYVTIVCMM